jgi:hypothetical protein
MQVFVDESGTEVGAPVTVHAAVILPSEQAVSWADNFLANLIDALKPEIELKGKLHAYDLFSGTGSFGLLPVSWTPC